MRCKYCEEFFSRFRCGKESHGECDCPKCQGYCKCDELHPSGLTMERWNWPFKTSEERKLVQQYFREHEAEEKLAMLARLQPPPV